MRIFKIARHKFINFDIIIYAEFHYIFTLNELLLRHFHAALQQLVSFKLTAH